MPRAVPMPIAKAYEFAAANGLESEADKIHRETPMHLGFGKGTQVRKAHMLDLFESHNLLDAFFRAHWPFGATEEGKGRRNDYNQDSEANEMLVAGVNWYDQYLTPEFFRRRTSVIDRTQSSRQRGN